jgi:hypothetical protein
LVEGYNELKTRAAAPASPTMRRLLCSEPAPLPKELTGVDAVALGEDDDGTPDNGLNVELADAPVADADMCTVVVALAYTSVLVIVLVEVSVVVTLLASTEAGASSATSAAVAVVKRICKDCG